MNKSDVTERVEKTLCPTWDQTLIFEQVEIHGDPALIVEKPPEVIIEIFDHDTFVSTHFFIELDVVWSWYSPVDVSDGVSVLLTEHSFNLQGSAEFLGRTEAHPMVKLDSSDMRMPVLQWCRINKGSRYGGELLAAFELILVCNLSCTIAWFTDHVL